MNKHEIGAKRINEILGENYAEKVMENFKDISADFANYIIDFAYGDLYAREGLSDKTREIAAVASLIGQGNTGLPLRSHLKAMLNVGWSQKEIIELILFLITYVGFPAIVEAINIAKEVFAESAQA